SPTSERRGPQVGPSLTAAARDGRIIVRAGTEEWLRREPNKRMAPNRRAKCRQTRYPDPKPSTVHQSGASPKSPIAPKVVAMASCRFAIGPALDQLAVKVNRPTSWGII